nr:hypothetical protein 1634Bnrm2_p099 [Cryptomonas sp.]
MNYPYELILVKNIQDQSKIIDLNSNILKKIILEIKEISKKAFLLINKKDISIEQKFYTGSNSAFLVLIIQKIIERKSRSMVMYFIYRLEEIKKFYWNNKYKFTKLELKINLRSIEVNFLQIYDYIRTKYFSSIGFELTDCYTFPPKNFLVKLKTLKNFCIVINEDSFKIFRKKSRIFFPRIGIERLISLGFLVEI